MRRGLVVAAFAALVLTGAAQAQEGTVVRETRCWLGSVTFSSGAQMHTGEGVAVCEGEAGWRQVEGQSSGCLLGGDLSSVGAVVGISNNDRLSLQCGQDGRWLTIEAAPKA